MSNAILASNFEPVAKVARKNGRTVRLTARIVHFIHSFDDTGDNLLAQYTYHV